MISAFNKILIPLALLFILSGFNEIQNIKTIEKNFIFFNDSPSLSDKSLITDSLNNLIEQRDLNENIKDLYKDSWVMKIQLKTPIRNKFNVNIKEHQPIAFIEDGSYLTQSGHLIYPKSVGLTLDIIRIEGASGKENELIRLNQDIQKQLNRVNKKTESIKLSSDDSLRISTEDGLVVVMTLKNFRDQLDRLEDFFSFELISGKKNLIKEMDLRYKKGISISYLANGVNA